MTRVAVRVALLLAVCVSAQAEKKSSPASPTTFLADALINKGASIKARTASGYYGYTEPEVASLTQVNIKSCRYTDCAADEAGGLEGSCPSTVAFQTDFTCPPKEHGYGYGDHERDLGMVGFSSTVGTCDWEISLYRWPTDAGEEPLTPMLTSEGVYKFGTAWGTCYLNADAENCESPLCERMAISIQGGLYGTNAYSTTSATEEQAIANVATALETCAGRKPGADLAGGRRPVRRQPGAAKKGGARVAEEGFNFWVWFLELIITLLRMLLSVTPPTPAAAQAAAPAPPQAKIANAQYQDVQVFPGIALIISGPFYEISSHDSNIQQTGLFELPIYYESFEFTATAPTNNWPIVSVKNAKLRFNHVKKQESYYGEGREDGREGRRD